MSRGFVDIFGLTCSGFYANRSMGSEVLLFLSRFAQQSDFGPLVQWIEFQIPVLTIWVRVPWGSLGQFVFTEV